MSHNSEKNILGKSAQSCNRFFDWKYAPIGLLLASFFVADLLIATVIDDPNDDDVAGMLLGVTFSQVVLFAAWATLGPARLLTRTISGFGATLLLALSLVSCINRMSHGTGEGWLWFVIVISQWVIMQLPLWVFRIVFGWRLSWPNETASERAYHETQFGIGQLMVWTALVGAVLGVGRLLVPEDLANINRTPHDAVAICSVLTLFNCLLAWPILWSALATRWWPAWLICAAICVLGLTFAEIFIFGVVMGQRGDEQIFWIMNTMQGAIATLTLLMMRVAGFRLMKIV